MRILIVGAGPTGLTAAVELARRGMATDVIDRKNEASTLSRAVGIMPRTLELLKPSGVTDRLLEEGIKLRQVHVFRERRKVLTLPLQGHPVRDYDYALALAQDRTEEALRDALVRLGGGVRYGLALSGLRQDGDKVVVATSDGVETLYDYVVGADGVRSKAREALGIDFPGFELPETWSIADVDAVNWPAVHVFTISYLPGGRVAVVVPLEPERFRVVSNTEGALETLPLDLEVTNIRREAQFTIAIRQVREYRSGRVFLAGDAAHCHSPVGGRGMNLGIADAVDLARRFALKELDGYSSSRHAVGAKTIALSERARKIATSPSAILRSFFGLSCRIVNVCPPFQRRVARTFLSG